MDEKKVPRPKPQNITLENRHKLNITGVTGVDSFNDEMVIVDTDLGVLIIRGGKLKIQKLNIESSELNIEGEISSCEYADSSLGSNSSGFFAKLFR